LSVEEFDETSGGFLADSDAIGDSNQVGVFKLHSGALVAIVKQYLEAGALLKKIKLLA